MTPKRLRLLVLGLIGLGLIFVALFGSRAIQAFREFRGHPLPPPGLLPESTPQVNDVDLIRDWMTIPFIARMYGIPPSFFYKALDISPRGNGEKSLIQLNSEYYPKAPGLVEERVKAVVLENLPQEDLSPTAPAP